MCVTIAHVRYYCACALLLQSIATVIMAEQSATVDLNDEEILQFIEINTAANTVRRTRSDLNVWNKWCAAVKSRGYSC